MECPDMSPVIIIGHRFVRILRDELSPSDFAEMLSRNRHEPNPAVCHSHDFCDANVYMADAFGGHPMDAGVWNAAWGRAKRLMLQEGPTVDERE